MDVVSNWISSGGMPDSELVAFDTMNQIECVLNQLPKNQRIAFTLSKLDGLSNTEIAEIMNATIIAVESLICRAKKKVAIDLLSILKK